MISVLIPVKDGGADLRRCLEAIQAQRVEDGVEIVVCDSGSSDDSVAQARRAGARVVQIPPEHFDHGATRNLLAREAHGEIVVFVSQDAYAEQDDWLARLTEPLRSTKPSDQDVAGVYGRQLAHHGARPPEVYFLDFLYGPLSRTQRIIPKPGKGVSMETTLFSNVNSAIRRTLITEEPFAEDMIMSEDQEWSRRMLLKGHELRYVAEAAVRHSHDYSLTAAFRRFFDSGVSAARSYTGGDGAESVLKARASAYAKGEISWLVRTGQARWIPYTVLYELTKLAGLQLGMRHERIPARIKPRLSALQGHWQRESRP